MWPTRRLDRQPEVGLGLVVAVEIDRARDRTGAERHVKLAGRGDVDRESLSVTRRKIAPIGAAFDA